MKRIRLLVFAFLLFACQPAPPPAVTIIDGENIVTLQTDERLPSAILNLANIAFSSNDRLLLNGFPIAPDQLISTSPITLQLHRALNVTIALPDGEHTFQTSALTVGEALFESGRYINVTDRFKPAINFPILQNEPAPFTIYQVPTNALSIAVDGQVIQHHSSAGTVGTALAEAGVPLIGADYSLPAENEALPSDGRIRVVRVRESILLSQRPIPFTSELVASADVPLDQNQILQPGENGLMMQRIRIRFEDGVEVVRTTEAETLVRPPKNRILAYGTKIEIKTTVVDGVAIEYWRAVQMYATSYSPCRSGTSSCSYGTSSGKRLTKGLVALRYSWYLNMAGQALFIPGYGFGTVADVCGGCVGKPWIDLGYDEDNYQPWSSWVTVYFLTPVPANIIYVLD